MKELGIIVLVIAAFFALREVITWYFKQNKIVEQNEKIIWLLHQIAKIPMEEEKINFRKLFGKK